MKNESDDEDDDSDTKMKDPLEFKIKTTRLVKVATPLIFKGKSSKLKIAATAGKATKAPKERKIEAAGPKRPLEKPPIEKDYQDWEKENWQLGESIELLEEWTKISTTDEKYAKYKRILTAEIQGLKNETRTTLDKQEKTYY
ncbi:hypothetical protein EG329_004096 [Mollisiaceae sp. DMI_Dod_QoI]|nr:hypothetical protein EG329_004096 [Helotiales sp. DMI_Dod_QoI]